MFNWKSKKFIGGLAALLCLGFGIPATPIAPMATEFVCQKIECE